jgi:membrane-associated phospholipid phosphatase
VPLFARRTYGRWTFLIAIAIAWSRVFLNVHHLSDVLVGTLVGTVTAYFVWARIGPLIEKRLRFRSFG